MKYESQDFIQANIAKLAELFPSVVTEAKGKDGQPEKIVNFEKLRQLLSSEVMEGGEAYEFTWVGKKASIVEAGRPSPKILRPCPEESKNWDSTENLYIEGDNLDALKLLQANYSGKIQVIYIDPPYNTGKDFIYRDNFAMNKADYKTQSREIAEIAEDENSEKQGLSCGAKSCGRLHSGWCSMIYPRLMLARNLLSDAGVIFISCDDNEQGNLKKICDELFGENNYITNFAIENNPKGRKNNAFVSNSYEYCLLYAKSSRYIYNILKKQNRKKFFNSLPRENDKRAALYDEDGEFRQSKRQVCGKNKSAQLAVNSEPGRRFTIYVSENRDKMALLDEYDMEKDEYVISPEGQKLIDNNYKRYVSVNSESNRPSIPLYTKDTLYKLFADNLLYFKDDGTIYEKDRELARQINSFVGNKKYSLDLTTESANSKMELLFGEKGIFANSKAVDFIKVLLFLYPGDNFTVLDFFSGSATTAHAVMRLNAEDNGKRKFIMAQAPARCAAESAAARAGYKNICEIGKERIRRAGEKIKRDNAGKPGIENLDTGFRVLKCEKIFP